MPRFGYRESMRDLLASIERLDPMVGPVELLCGWFDDLYLPAKCLDITDSEALADWSGCFTEAQRQALAEFHRAFEMIADDLSTDPRDFETDPNWKRLSVLAGETLIAFDKGTT